MEKGWFIGDFNPSLFRTDAFEVAVKEYKAGDSEQMHFHKVATEYTVITKGRVRMFDREWGEGDIVIAEPGDITGFSAITDAQNVVVKIPCVRGDKYILED